MRSLILILGLLSAGPAWCEDIVDVLRRSQDMRLAAMPEVAPDGAQAQVVRASFDRVMRTLPAGTPAALRVVSGAVMAETLHGHIVAANQELAGLPEGARLFILAHELGHVVQNHWLQMALVYQKWVPGVVTQVHTDAVNGHLQRDASRLAHQQEFEADAFAARTLMAMGRCAAAPAPDDVSEIGTLACHDDMLAVFQQPGALRDTPTHPGAGRRLAALRAHAYEPAVADAAPRR